MPYYGRPEVVQDDGSGRRQNVRMPEAPRHHAAGGRVSGAARPVDHRRGDRSTEVPLPAAQATDPESALAVVDSRPGIAPGLSRW